MRERKSRIRETPNILGCADISTDTKQNPIIGSKVSKLPTYQLTNLPTYQLTTLPNYQITK